MKSYQKLTVFYLRKQNKKIILTQNSDMESLILLVPLFFIILLVVPIPCTINIGINSVTKRATVNIRILKFRIALILFEVKGNDILLKTESHKEEVELKVSPNEVRFIEQFMVQIKQKLDVKKISFYSNVGIGDSFLTAMLNGFINLLVINIFSFIQSAKPHSTFILENNQDYNNKNLTITMIANISSSVIDIIYSFIMSLVIIKRREKYEERTNW